MNLVNVISVHCGRRVLCWWSMFLVQRTIISWYLYTSTEVGSGMRKVAQYSCTPRCAHGTLHRLTATVLQTPMHPVQIAQCMQYLENITKRCQYVYFCGLKCTHADIYHVLLILQRWQLCLHIFDLFLQLVQYEMVFVNFSFRSKLIPQHQSSVSNNNK